MSIDPLLDSPTSTQVTISRWYPGPQENDVGLMHRVDSYYVEQFYLPVLGPTATWLLRRLHARLVDNHDLDVELDLVDLASDMGMSFRPGINNAFAKALHRLVMFGCAHQTRDGFAIRAELFTLTSRQLRRLTAGQQFKHHVTIEQLHELDNPVPKHG